MSQVIAALNRDHANVAKLLDLLESEILAIEVGKTPDYPLLRNIMQYITQYPDRYHHPKEDLIFAQLVRREPEVRADVEALLKEHVSLNMAGREFGRLLRTTDVDSVHVREGIGAAGLAYIRALREHMLIEEGILFPIAMEVLTPEDWKIIDEGVNTIDDPLFGSVIADEYQRLYNLIIDRTERRAVT
jgi:hemerythrin-like domain-containing protein